MLKRNIKKKPNKKKGQSTVEYIVLVAAVLAAILIFLGPSGIFQSTLNSALNEGTAEMLNMAERITGAH